MADRTIHLLGVPLRSGSMMPGSESDAPAYREAGLLQRLSRAGCNVVDQGDLAIPSYLPHHAVPPIRNWPGPRIVWDLLAGLVADLLAAPGHLPLLVGCDCSVVVGTVQALRRHSTNVHVLYIDGDFDDAPPDPAHCQSGAALAVWLLTNSSPFCSGPLLQPSQVTVFGWSQPSRSPQAGVGSLSLSDIRRAGGANAARSVLNAIPATADILVHLDIDVLGEAEFPAAYFPHSEGLSLSELDEVLSLVLADPRVRLLEVSEYATLRDMNRSSITRLVEILSDALTGQQAHST